MPPEQRPAPKTRGPLGAGSDADLVGHIRRVLAESPFSGEGYRKVWARLRHQGIRTASERVRRLTREHHLRPHAGAAHRTGRGLPAVRSRPRSQDRMGGTDMTTTVTTGEGLQVHVLRPPSAHCTCECIGLHVAKRGDRFEALEPLRQGVREHFGGFDRDIARGLSVRHDHGSAYMSDDFQRELTFLGMESSPSFVREPEGNGCAERFVRTLKEQLLWVRSFATAAELAEALGEFKRTYNEQWVIRRHGHRTPSRVRRDLVNGVQAAA